MTALLLDTHVLLWASAESDRLGETTATHLLDPSNRVFVSAVSAAEIAIKRTIGKLDMAVSVQALLEPIGAEELALTLVHAMATERLPHIHRDPFDRLLAAQASEEGLTLVSADDRLLEYPITSLDART